MSPDVAYAILAAYVTVQVARLIAANARDKRKAKAGEGK